MEELTYPLTSFDTACSPTTMTYGYVLSKTKGQYFDAAAFLQAVERAAEKWRFLAGRVSIDAKTGLYHIRVPTGPTNEPVAKLTTAIYDRNLNHSHIACTSTSIAQRPPLKYFSKSLPVQFSSFAKNSLPLLFIHVSHFRDATCLGISTSHGVFDGTGMYLVLHAITAEFAGRPWTPPLLHNTNTFADALAVLPPTSLGPQSNDWKREWKKFTIGLMFRLVFKTAYERVLRGVKPCAVYLDQATVDAIVEPVKRELKGGGEWASTGDILVAWFLKSALSRETVKSGRVSISTAISLRNALSDLESYPHNAMVVSSMRPFSRRDISSLSIAQLASLHRSHVTHTRTHATIAAIADFFGPPRPSPKFMFNRRLGEHSFMLPNQVQCGLTSLEFGDQTELVGFWEWCNPLDLDHIVFINSFEGGYTISSPMRASRWKAIKDELKLVHDSIAEELDSPTQTCNKSE